MAPYALVLVLYAFVFDNECLREAKEKFDVFVNVSFSCWCVLWTVAVCFKVKLGKFLKPRGGDVLHDHVQLYSVVVPYTVLVEFWNKEFSVASFVLEAYA